MVLLKRDLLNGKNILKMDVLKCFHRCVILLCVSPITTLWIQNFLNIFKDLPFEEFQWVLNTFLFVHICVFLQVYMYAHIR